MKLILTFLILIAALSFQIFSKPPVELIHYDVRTFTDHNVIEWATASELNSKEFVVERKALSLDTGYIEIGIIPAAGMSASQKEYILRDSLFNPMYDNVYRLKMVDLDGSFTYSNERQIGPAFSVDISSFELNYNNEIMEIKWETTNESMVDHFELKKKVYNYVNNTRNWSKDFTAKGDKATVTEYLHSDSDIIEGDSLEYALFVNPKNSSQDTFLISRTIALKINSLENWKNATLKISPNPATDFIEIQLKNVILSEAKNPVVVYDVLGIEHPATSWHPSAEGNIRIDISSLSPGVYFVRIGDKVYKFVKL